MTASLLLAVAFTVVKLFGQYEH